MCVFPHNLFQFWALVFSLLALRLTFSQGLLKNDATLGIDKENRHKSRFFQAPIQRAYWAG
jgi:hypothetical protein